MSDSTIGTQTAPVAVRRPRLSPLNARRCRTSRLTGAAGGPYGFSCSCSSLHWSVHSLPMTSRSSFPTKVKSCFRWLVDYPEEKFNGFYAVTDYRDPIIQDEINANGWAIWPPIRYSYRTVNNEHAGYGAIKTILALFSGAALRPLSAGCERPELHIRQHEHSGHG
jgi:microcin C transport system permease protein